MTARNATSLAARAALGPPVGGLLLEGARRPYHGARPSEADSAVNSESYEALPIAWVESSLVELAQAPKQGDEGAPAAWLVFEPEMSEAIRDLRVGEHIIVVSWLDRARRDVLSTHPRGDPHSPLTGVFSTRSPDRPNPIGLHRVQILEVEGLRLLVSDLEALNGTPILDVKPVLDVIGGAIATRRP